MSDLTLGTGSFRLTKATIGKQEGLLVQGSGFLTTRQLLALSGLLSSVAQGQGPHAQAFERDRDLEIQLKLDPERAPENHSVGIPDEDLKDQVLFSGASTNAKPPQPAGIH